jgi:hypothetical protein
MKRLFSKITINDAKTGKESVFTYVNEITIKSTWKEFVDTCEITLPKNTTKNGKPLVAGLNSLFSRGDKIKVELGYYPKLETYFTGYISKIELNTPIKLYCENETFLLKQKTFTKSYKSVTLKTLLSDIIDPSIKVSVPDSVLGAFRIKNVTPLQVLGEIKSTYGMEAFFKNGTLYVGLMYIPEFSQVWNITHERNVIDSSLNWQNEDDVKIKVKAISMKPDNSKIEIEVGDEGGEQRTAHYFNLTEKQLKEIATREIVKFKFTGFRGGFTTFGNSKISHGDIINLRSKKLSEQNGTYFVDGVETTFGQSGFRQRVELGRKAIVNAGASVRDLENSHITIDNVFKFD